MSFELFSRKRRNGRNKACHVQKARPRRTVSLNLERLEDRMVPSATPNPIAILQSDNSLWEMTAGGTQLLSPAGTILTTSTVTDGSGNTDVFAISSDHTLWQYAG